MIQLKKSHTEKHIISESDKTKNKCIGIRIESQGLSNYFREYCRDASLSRRHEKGDLSEVVGEDSKISGVELFSLGL